jgi:hypothetical protein
MRFLITATIFAFTFALVPASAQKAAPAKGKDRGTCTAMVEKAGTYSSAGGRRNQPAFAHAVARCMKGQPI